MVKRRRRRKVPKPLVRGWLFAAERGDLRALKRLLATEPRLLDALGPGPYWKGNFRALHYAVSRGHRRVIRWLLARGAAATPTAGESDWAPLHFAALPPRPELVQLLIEHGAQMDIFAAAALGRVKVVRKLLRDEPQLVSRRGPDGATPLHFAGSAGVARTLLDAGADPTWRDSFHDQTAMEWGDRQAEGCRSVGESGGRLGHSSRLRDRRPTACPIFNWAQPGRHQRPTDRSAENVRRRPRDAFVCGRTIRSGKSRGVSARAWRKGDERSFSASRSRTQGRSIDRDAVTEGRRG